MGVNISRVDAHIWNLYRSGESTKHNRPQATFTSELPRLSRRFKIVDQQSPHPQKLHNTAGSIFKKSILSATDRGVDRCVEQRADEDIGLRLPLFSDRLYLDNVVTGLKKTSQTERTFRKIIVAPDRALFMEPLSSYHNRH